MPLAPDRVDRCVEGATLVFCDQCIVNKKRTILLRFVNVADCNMQFGEPHIVGPDPLPLSLLNKASHDLLLFAVARSETETETDA